MANLTYKDLLLSFPEYIILVRIRFFSASAKYALSDNRKFLRKYGLVELSPHFKNRYRLSDNGKMYLRYRFRSFWKFAIPTIISIIALFGGYDVYTYNGKSGYRSIEGIPRNLPYLISFPCNIHNSFGSILWPCSCNMSRIS